jgi:hypothetical protein
MSEVPSTLKQGLAHELANAKLIALSDVGGAIGAGFEARVSLIRAKVDARGDVGGLRCHTSGLHSQQAPQHLSHRCVRNINLQLFLWLRLSSTAFVVLLCQEHKPSPFCGKGGRLPTRQSRYLSMMQLRLVSMGGA